MRCHSPFASLQIPNFLLAAPTLCAAFYGSKSYVAGLHRGSQRRPTVGFHTPAVAPFVVQWAVMATIAVLIMNVQARW